MFVFLLFFSLRVCNVSGLACTAFVHADSAFRVLVFMRVFSCLCAFLVGVGGGHAGVCTGGWVCVRTVSLLLFLLYKCSV